MPDPEPKVPQPPAQTAAAAEEAAVNLTDPTFMDLSQATPWTKNVVEPQFTILSSGYVGTGSVRAKEEIVKAATDRNLPAPLPAALVIYGDPTNPRALYGVPTTKRSPAFLTLSWRKNNEVKANFRAILLMKEIAIPPESRMVINVEKINHPIHQHCVKLSWAEDCFIPMNERTSTANNTSAE
ncbi:MAG: hypothetical protein ACOY94_04850 [Bacillota bacterium]